MALWLDLIAILGFPLYLWRLIFGKRLIIGKLNEVLPGAGKVRIVACTDWWTQYTLKPLHDAIFRVLRTLPTDGTFNQTAPLLRLCEINRINQSLFSYDLSAATDRLPIDIQYDILSELIPWANHWKNLLVKRRWWYKGNALKYAVGQPMGAYSSWAMLALTHHCVVQIAASRVGYSSFSDYAVLGDDIVIGDASVAKAYLALMQEHLGVSINLSKSLVSSDTCEFAKRLIHRRLDISPLGAGLILCCIRGIGMLPTLFSSIQCLSTNVVLCNIMNLRLSYNRRRKVLLATLLEMSHFLETDRSTIVDTFWQVLGLTNLPLNRRRLVEFHMESYVKTINSRDESHDSSLERAISRMFSESFAGPISGLLVFCSPALWAYAQAFEREGDSIFDFGNDYTYHLRPGMDIIDILKSKADAPTVSFMKSINQDRELVTISNLLKYLRDNPIDDSSPYRSLILLA